MAVIPFHKIEGDHHHHHHNNHHNPPSKSAKFVALICGVTGIVGRELARNLLSSKSTHWKVYGIARASHSQSQIKETIKNHSNFHYISCNLQNPSETQQKLSCLTDVTHVFWVTWASQFPLDTPECCEENKVMMSNVLNAVLPQAKGLKHFSLQTGTKHYISFDEPLINSSGQIQLYDEQCPRVGKGFNFYYVLEDLLKERLEGKIPWSIHRPGLIMGCSNRTLYNFIGTVSVYGTICKKLKLPFLFGGTKECWEEVYIDASDVRLVAEQHIWAATEETVQCSSHGQAFNSINGSDFTWKEIWPAIGLKFGNSDHDAFLCQDFSFTASMADKGQLWREIVEEEGLVQTEMDDLANWEFLDILFRFPIKMLGSRKKADGFGFTMKFQTLDSILYWIDIMRHEKLIP
ncbi:OLC1v1006214C1 [Oldenlandia corymbosa var. corymbosa]|uniref:OLC1v1006214C1 n=1 Tax=Oldenlandia corymbosa var. corymbosa TaxID=529605 RepID=A0AAV1DJU1_OLDCO|nr:OLC1v1006214C1 [Oldenlandia corymbosa var. corymbosa]